MKSLYISFMCVISVFFTHELQSVRKCNGFSCFAAMLQRKGEAGKQEVMHLTKPGSKKYEHCSRHKAGDSRLRYRVVPLLGVHFMVFPAKGS